jgi:hypothetical protein
VRRIVEYETGHFDGRQPLDDCVRRAEAVAAKSFDLADAVERAALIPDPKLFHWRFARRGRCGGRILFR